MTGNIRRIVLFFLGVGALIACVLYMPLIAELASQDEEAVPIEVSIEKLKDNAEAVRDKGYAELEAAGREAESQLIEVVQDPTLFFKTRAAACELLGKVGSREAVPALIDALTDKSYGVRSAATFALIDIDDRRIGHEVGKLLQDEREYVRQAAILLLDERNDLTAASAVRDALRRDSSYQIRANAARALGRMRDEEALYLLIEKATDDESIYVREEAVSALRQLGDPRAIPALIHALREESRSMQKKALYGLEDITDKYFGYDPDAWETWYKEQR